MTVNKQAYRPDGGDIGTDRLKEIAHNVYGDEEKCWLAKRVLALLDELEALKVASVLVLPEAVSWDEQGYRAEVVEACRAAGVDFEIEGE